MNTIFLGSYENTYLRQFYVELYELPEKMLVAYLNLYWLIPAFLMKRKYWKYGISLSVMILGMAFIMRAIYVLWLAPIYFPDTVNLPFFHTYRLLKYIFYNINGVVIITTGFRLFNYWYYQQQLNNELVQAKLKAELGYLRAQLHPHFLFNTLNNIYSLCLDKSDLAPGVVLKLSDLLSYMLYDSEKERIELLKDIERLKSYLELERVRYGNRLNISFNRSGDMQGRQIAPLIMLPFVENAFKHGFDNDLNNIWITIDIKLKDDMLYMKIKNSLNKTPQVAPQANGIGLQNIRRRLELLYPDRHSLEMISDSDYFEVDLKINLT
ncbi:sensor histidine kinase [Mucilaginibacter ginsenosidivorans]|uniref:Sensor histidine kinase n=1 Tax=Mucilaginibacter ginsenosidivorans TaxID=398053 RepID=A0A5B8V118_9SPHI|nr:histidine kinase [Mucilaginibacter ginsenosidivorans]QEC65207.1 sensor histidine kinase [Mucilaginibacter ginsenosidivorans]